MYEKLQNCFTQKYLHLSYVSLQECSIVFRFFQPHIPHMKYPEILVSEPCHQEHAFHMQPSPRISDSFSAAQIAFNIIAGDKSEIVSHTLCSTPAPSPVRAQTLPSGADARMHPVPAHSANYFFNTGLRVLKCACGKEQIFKM